MSIESIIDMVCNDLFLIFKIYYNLFHLWLLPQKLKLFLQYSFVVEEWIFWTNFQRDSSLGKTTLRLGFCFTACVGMKKEKVGKKEEKGLRWLRASPFPSFSFTSALAMFLYGELSSFFLAFWIMQILPFIFAHCQYLKMGLL